MMSDDWHKQRYEGALRYAAVEGPAWESLTEEQRENIRRVNRSHDQWMHDLGRAIRYNSELPPYPTEGQFSSG